MAVRSINDVRRCSRNGCRWPASASLTYAYNRSTVWIEDLTASPHPAAYDLCAAHAERLAVPIGWEKLDLRVVPPSVTPLRPEHATWTTTQSEQLQTDVEPPQDASAGA